MVSKVPSWRVLSLRVNLGPSSCKLTFLEFLKMYLEKIRPSMSRIGHASMFCLPVLSKEDVIPLTVESDHSSSMELGVLWVKSSQHPGNCMAQAGGEVVEYNLRLVVGSSAMTLDVVTTNKVCELEVCRRSLREMYQPKPIQKNAVKDKFLMHCFNITEHTSVMGGWGMNRILGILWCSSTLMIAVKSFSTAMGMMCFISAPFLSRISELGMHEASSLIR